MSDSLIDALLSGLAALVAAVLLLLVVRWSPLRQAIARRSVRRQFTAPLRFFELSKPLPRRLAAVGEQLEAAGATFVTAREVLIGARGEPLAQALYLADGGAILCEVVCGFDPSHPDPASSCLSQVGTGALLVTEGLRNAPEIDGELLQVFPGAPATELLTEHRNALELLRARGIRVGTIQPDDARAALDAWSALTRAAWEEQGDVFADRFVAAARSGQHDQNGPLRARPDLEAQLAALG